MPSVVAVSPTMRCNYDCQGCYSRGRCTEDELTTDELEALFEEAEELGVQAMVVTGGEPLLRPDLLSLMVRHRRLFFVLVTNGSLLTPTVARHIARSGNVVVLVSIEGWKSDTDDRRQWGAHENALRALRSLRSADAFFGFASMVTTANVEHLSTGAFVAEMISLGCAVGYFTEYVPCGPNPRQDWVLNGDVRAAFRRRVVELQRRNPIVIIQFPHDEYGEENRCSAAGRKSIHINSQGDVEPCPFVSVAQENVKRGGLMAALRSPFLRAIREHPYLLERRRFACALFEHRAEIDALVGKLSQE